MRSAGRLGGGGDDGRGQRVILAEAARQRDAIRFALTVFVERPERGGRDAGDVAADDDLDGQHIGLVADSDVGVRNGDDVVVDDVADLLEPPGAQLVEHLALVGDRTEDAVESRNAVGGDQNALAIRGVDVADLAGLLLAPPGQVNRSQCVGHRFEQFFMRQHFTVLLFMCV